MGERQEGKEGRERCRKEILMTRAVSVGLSFRVKMLLCLLAVSTWEVA